MKTDPFPVIGARPYVLVRDACHRLKQFGERALSAQTRQAFFEAFPLTAKELEHLAEAVPHKALLIPVPGHNGSATYTKALAWAVLALCPEKHVFVYDCLEGPQRESLCDRKRKGQPIEDVPVVFRVKDNLLGAFNGLNPLFEQYSPVLVDNVVDTGRTAQAAMAALGIECPVLAIGTTENYQKNQ